jgi:hypothetical protein
MTSSAQRNTCRSNIVRPGGEAFRFRVLSLRPEGFGATGAAIHCIRSHERRNLPNTVSQWILSRGTVEGLASTAEAHVNTSLWFKPSLTVATVGSKLMLIVGERWNDLGRGWRQAVTMFPGKFVLVGEAGGRPTCAQIFALGRLLSICQNEQHQFSNARVVLFNSQPRLEFRRIKAINVTACIRPLL